jgi:hypothetical protein
MGELLIVEMLIVAAFLPWANTLIADFQFIRFPNGE